MGLPLPQIHVLLYRGKGLIDALIRWQTDGRVAHAALRNGGEVIESTPRHGVRIRPYTPEDALAETYSPDVTPDEWHRAWNFALSQVGKKYDWLGIFRFLVRNKDQNPNRWFCSELIAAALPQLVVRTQPYRVSPEGLRRSPLLISI
jgi:hypothetical protein